MIFLQGTGKFDFDIVGENYRQPELQQIAGPKTETAAAHICLAGLTLDNNNKFDKNAVAVALVGAAMDKGYSVGFLDRKKAIAFRKQIAALNIAPTEIIFTRAMIVGGWKSWEEIWPDEDDDPYGTAEPTLELSEGLFGVKLDLRWPCVIDAQFEGITINRL